jgi:hypothetical protein
MWPGQSVVTALILVRSSALKIAQATLLATETFLVPRSD